jgi:glycosyltransferase involved in cell wall biosynthesis
MTNPRRVNVLEVTGICGGGLGRHVRGLCEDLLLQGHRVTLVYTPHDIDQALQQFASDRQKEIGFIPLDIRREVSPVSDIRAIDALMRLIRLEGPFDVIHGHSAKGGVIARIAGRFSGVPTVYTPNALIMSSPEISRLQATVYTLIERALGHRATSRIIAVSEEERELILELKLVPNERVVLIENGIDDEDIEYFSTRTACQDMSQKPCTEPIILPADQGDGTDVE